MTGMDVIPWTGPKIEASVQDFEAARTTRHRQYLPQTVTDSPRMNDSWTRTTMLARARWIINNVGLVKGVIKDMARYSVGTGIKPQSQIKDPVRRRAYETYFEQWSGIAEVSGLTWKEVLTLGSAEVDVDGDHGIGLTETLNGYPQVQCFRGHRIKSPGDARPEQRIVDGVRLNRVNAPLAYYVTTEGDSLNPWDYKTAEIEAKNFHLLIERDNTDDVRGKTRLHTAINRIQDIWETLETTTSTVKAHAKIALLITQNGGGSGPGAPKPFLGNQTKVGDAATGEITLEKLHSGVIARLNQGEDVKGFKSDVPNPMFEGFLDYLVRDIACGLGVPVEFIWDPTKLGTNGGRLILQKAVRRMEERQDMLIKLCKRVWGYVVSKAVKRGDLEYDEDWWQVIWQRPAKISVDIGRDSKANIEDMKYGVRTKTEDAAERGEDIEDIEATIDGETERLFTRAFAIYSKLTPEQKALVSLQMIIDRLSQASPNPVSEPPKETNATATDE
jgi:capsid protein